MPGRLAARATRVVPARGQRPDAPAADHPRGGARATTSRACTPTARHRCRGAIFSSGLFAEGWAVYVTQVMMDVGLRRGRPGAAADPLEVLPALGHQRDHRRPDPHRRDDRGRGRRPHGRRRVPGGGRGARQVQPRAPVVDPAVDLLRGLDGDVGHRARGAPARGRGRGAEPAAIRPGALPGGFGETPGFRYRQHLEAVIGTAPPTSLLRRILFD